MCLCSFQLECSSHDLTWVMTLLGNGSIAQHVGHRDAVYLHLFTGCLLDGDDLCVPGWVVYACVHVSLATHTLRVASLWRACACLTSDRVLSLAFLLLLLLPPSLPLLPYFFSLPLLLVSPLTSSPPLLLLLPLCPPLLCLCVCVI